MKRFIIYLLPLILSFIFPLSCTGQESAVNEAPPTGLSKNTLVKNWNDNLPSVIYDSAYGKIIVIDSVTPMIFPGGGKFSHGYVVDHYEPEPGKILGYWPEDYTPSNLANLKNHWGYSGIFISPDQTQYNNVTSAGFDTSKIMMSIAAIPDYGQYKIFVNNFNVGFYYIDEAVEHNCTGNQGLNHRLYNLNELDSIKNYIHTNRPNSEFVISGYKRCSHLVLAVPHSDRVMYSSYISWVLQSMLPALCNSNINWGTQMEKIWLQGSSDQGESWSDMRNLFATKFSMTWMGSNEIPEFENLFEQAKGLGLDAVWVYIFNGHGVDQLENISEAAFNNGFLKKIIKRYSIEWRYREKVNSEKSKSDNSDSVWYVYNIKYEGVQEVNHKDFNPNKLE